MLEPEHLNPNDVLRHLNDLGFQNISTQQLKDFIHDLKKLIRYEQKRSKSIKSREPCDRIDHSDCECFCKESSVSNSEILSDVSCGRSVTSDASLCSYKSGEEKPRSITSGNSQKIPSSFIRPKNRASDNSFKSRKNLDPVSLYHHYQKIWKNNKIPGESNHSQLRWMIRNKMLGQEPQ